jgi:hypothetical protein
MTTKVWQFNVQIETITTTLTKHKYKVLAINFQQQIQGACNNCSTTIKDDFIPYISSMDNPHACWRRLQGIV